MLVYLATPYSLNIKSNEIGLTRPDYSQQEKEIKQKRFEVVNEVAANLIQKGFMVISPISHSHPIAAQCKMEGDFETWAKLDFTILSKCDMVFVLCQRGWEDSKGVHAEINFATQNRIPIMFIDETLNIIKAG